MDREPASANTAAASQQVVAMALACPASLHSLDKSTAESDGTKDVKAVVLHVNDAKLQLSDAVPGVSQRLPAGRRAWHWLCSVPSYWWIALSLFLALEAIAVVGAVYYTRSVQYSSMSQVTEVAKTSARALEKLLEDQKAPILFLSTLIQRNPNWPSFNATFLDNARAIYEHYPYYEIEACPYGYVGAMEFPWLNLTGWDEYKFKLDFDYQKDLLDPTRDDWAFNVWSIQQPGIILAGPWYGEGPLASGAFVMRHNIFLPAADAPSWDMPNTSITNTSIVACPDNACNQGNLTFWGWANSVFVFDDIKAGLLSVVSHSLLYSLAPSPAQLDEGQSYPFIAISNPPPDNATQICVNVQGDSDNWYWPLCISDPSGNNFWPAWFPGLIVGVTALAILISVLVLLVLRSRSRAVSLLEQQLLTNRQLAVAKEEAESRKRAVEAEKTRIESLMQRQHQLIELFASAQPASPSATVRSDTSARERIEEMRHRLARNSTQRSGSGNSTGNFDIVLLELLGEGSFGKVYRGTWRGTEVAVKTMVLPSYMSGNEKREKMLIMETAISSALAHPNIVQTFTYSIDNLVENDRTPPAVSSANAVDGSSFTALENCLVVGGTQATAGSPSAPLSPARAAGARTGNSTVTMVLQGVSTESAVEVGAQQKQQRQAPRRSVHGYEVRLVLEYCDRGCLHDALAQDAFMNARGLNFQAILDTALDVTRAMVHLHMADVLHGDLKARNVMLKSSGTEGRGVTAKIADFGLAVRIDTTQQTHMSNLFQGTLTHMAPELLLHGRMSKAADVYAFGIMLYELFTASEPFHGVPQALLGHQVIHERKRPAFPMRPPEDFARLVEDCWHSDPLMRPSFEAIMPRLQAMRAAFDGPTPPLMPYTLAPPASLVRQQQEAALDRAGGNAGFDLHLQSDELYQVAGASGMTGMTGVSGASGVTGVGSTLLLVSNSGCMMSSYCNSGLGYALDTVVEEQTTDCDSSSLLASGARPSCS